MTGRIDKAAGRWFGLAGLALALLNSRDVRADERNESKLAALSIEYAAPESCPGRAAFEAALTARLYAPIDARLGPIALRARFEAGPGGFRASMALHDAQGAVRERSIEARTCREAIEALALITALALQPHTVRESPSARARHVAARGPRPSKPASKPEPLASESNASDGGAASAQVALDSLSSEGSGDSLSNTDAPPPERAAAPVSVPNEENPVARDSLTREAALGPPIPAASSQLNTPALDREAKPRARSRIQLVASAAGLLSTGIAPRLLPGVELAAQLHFSALDPLDLSARVAARFVPPGQVDRDAGSARFSFAGGSVAACAGAKLVPALAAAGCAALESGAVFARGIDTGDAASFQRPWLALGPMLQLSWLGLAPFQIQANFELLFPALRDSYRLGEPWVHRVPASVLRAGLALGLTL